MALESIIGLEIHVQLKTATKMFCGCSNRGEYESPNVTICPVCLGHPGTLPVINQQAVEYGLLAGLALGGRVTPHAKFDRKNYFYPDLPKGYQISQFDLPVIAGGALEFVVKKNDGSKRVMRCRITRLHLEEDAAKLHHTADEHASLVDFNRGGTPLAEIVTEPDMRTPAEAKAFLQELRLIMRYLGVSDADMEKGHLRCDANISLREATDRPDEEGWVAKLNPKTEVKNINSFRAVEHALEYEIKRQTKLWLDGTPVNKQSTRGWDDAKGITVEQRAKEGMADYRYFPEPDLPPLELTELAEKISRTIPELPAARRLRFMTEYGFSDADTDIMVEDKALGDYAEKVMSELRAWTSSHPDTDLTWEAHRERFAKLVSGWLLSKLGGIMAEQKLRIDAIKVTPENFAELLALLANEKITSTNGLLVLIEMVATGGDPSQIIVKKNLGRIENNDELIAVIQNVIAANPKVVADWKSGKQNAIQFLVGQIMKVTRGKASPESARAILEKELEK